MKEHKNAQSNNALGMIQRNSSVAFFVKFVRCFGTPGIIFLTLELAYADGVCDCRWQTIRGHLAFCELLITARK
jgi:hypothetical protein